MMGEKDGGPAFPTDGMKYEDGMSLRDWFAGQALVGLIASTANPNSGGPAMHNPDMYGTNAYKLADAMLKAREGDERTR